MSKRISGEIRKLFKGLLFGVSGVVAVGVVMASQTQRSALADVERTSAETNRLLAEIPLREAGFNATVAQARAFEAMSQAADREAQRLPPPQR